MSENRKQLDAIPVTVDTTDHFDFICPDCGATMQIDRVETTGVKERNSIEPCTRFFMTCPLCKGYGYRKIYWNRSSYCAEVN